MTWLLKSINHLQNGSSDLPCRDRVHIPPGEVQKNIIDLCKSADWLVGCMWYTSKEGTEGTPKTWSKINVADLISRHLRKLFAATDGGIPMNLTIGVSPGFGFRAICLYTTLIFSTYQIPWCQKWGCFGQPPPVWHSAGLKLWRVDPPFHPPWWLVDPRPPWGGSKTPGRLTFLDPKKKHRYLEKKLEIPGHGEQHHLKVFSIDYTAHILKDSHNPPIFWDSRFTKQYSQMGRYIFSRSSSESWPRLLGGSVLKACERSM